MERKKTVSFLQSISSSPLPPQPPQSPPQPPSADSHSPHLFDSSSNPAMPSSSSSPLSSPSPPPPAPVFPTDYLQLFPLPTQTKLQNIPKIKFYSKISSPGYDMRTIRKHIEQLHQEILSHHNIQGIIYNQNEILWNDLQYLTHSCYSNYSNILQQEIKKLNQYYEFLFHKKKNLHKEFQKGHEILLDYEKLICYEKELQQILLDGRSKEMIALEELQRYSTTTLSHILYIRQKVLSHFMLVFNKKMINLMLHFKIRLISSPPPHPTSHHITSHSL